MTTYICNILVLSLCSFENTPIIYDYSGRSKFMGKTYIETATLQLSNKENTTHVEIKQIETSHQMYEFIRIALENTDIIVIYEQTNKISRSIRELVEISHVKTIINITNENTNSVNNKINNEILKLINSSRLNELSRNVEVPVVDTRTPTIFGNVENQLLINFDRCLDRWLFCCIN